MSRHDLDFGFGIYDDFFRKDADDEPDAWITTKSGTHIPLDDEGKPMNKVGKEILGKSEDAPKVNTHNPKRNYGSYSVPKVVHGSTLEKYTKNGKLTPERQKLHQQIIDGLLDGIPKPKGQPTTTFLGGGPASGKSSITKDTTIETPDENQTVCIDSDKIKKLIPEYKEALANGAEDAADMVHAESSMIAWKALAIAQQEGYNCMMDGTGDGSVDDMLQSIREAKAAGHKVEGVYATCETDEAVRRAWERARNPESEDFGRKVPEAYIRKTHRSVSEILPKIASEFDSIRLYCTDAGKEPRLIATGGNGKGLTAKDSNLYDMFVQKQNEEMPESLTEELR